MIWETGPERGAAKFSQFWFSLVYADFKIQTGPSQLFSFLFPVLFFFFFFVLLKRLNNAAGYIVWSNISKNRRVAVKLKINIQPLQDDKRVKQTCSDALDAPVAADNNGWNLKARFWGKTDTNKKKNITLQGSQLKLSEAVCITLHAVYAVHPGFTSVQM